MYKMHEAAPNWWQKRTALEEILPLAQSKAFVYTYYYVLPTVQQSRLRKQRPNWYVQIKIKLQLYNSTHTKQSGSYTLHQFVSVFKGVAHSRVRVAI